MDLMERLISRGISRRDFVKLCATTAAAIGLGEGAAPQVAAAVESAAKKPAVIWLEGQDCAGCSESFLATIKPSAAEVVLDMISLRYHETVMGSSGTIAEEVLEETIKEGGYVLVVEGSVPTENDKFCYVAGKPWRETLIKAAQNASVVLAAGACSAYGGIPAAGPTGAKGVADVVDEQTKQKVINLPHCPVKPSVLLATIIYYLTYKSAPELDAYRRPKLFYSNLLHDNCPRRGHFENGEFVTDWNDPKQKDYCLLLMGCKGPKTYTNCAQVWWNDGANFCINAGSPCAGCSQPEFYHKFTPLYDKQEIIQKELPGIGATNVDTIGKVIGGAAAVAAAVHFAGSKLTKKEE
ncbi:hydrogenase small subunit [Carboxydocella sporoproducens DSM 16521]|uniref:Hydrogenase small subunit n=2 Tax=Carboxydocella TaxID=178898 RepID=A0A1T4S2S2_9FIRM|nr:MULTISPECIES: hydrogenase small subunit [Carboxydocella]AVX20669.1 hydrogenase small subunit [Carboxydocella thermautotrophica]AVX31089.1 hydrogenase small subunit [Carboxydocella thermautotrophica]SKA22457.1 hydrogenase small subunit [Carboxydocella sporoproducens DSM 16521]